MCICAGRLPLRASQAGRPLCADLPCPAKAQVGGSYGLENLPGKLPKPPEQQRMEPAGSGDAAAAAAVDEAQDEVGRVHSGLLQPTPAYSSAVFAF